MNSPDVRLNPHLEAALQRLRTAAEQAAERGAEGMGMAALSAGQHKRRDALLAAQFLFRKQQALFGQRFHQSLRGQMAGEQRPKQDSASSKPNWGELSLMNDEQVDAMVAADRIGLAIGHQSEWELRDVESYLPGLGVEGGDRNPLRPALVAQALLDAIHALTDDHEARQFLIDEMTRSLAQEMRACYADIAQLFRSRGLRPQDLRVRGTEAAGGHTVQHSSYGPLGQTVHSQQGMSGFSSRGGLAGSGPAGFAAPGRGGAGSSWGAATGSRAAPGMLGAVDPQMMDLLRRLAFSPATLPTADMGEIGETVGAGMSTLAGGWESGLGDLGQPAWGGQPMPPNLIVQHRDELRQAATGQLDHMVIDVIGSLFDQILADPKVPPQMARLIARLQLPVLRAALGDRSFFSSRRHPVRRFINRTASLACAFDDFSEDPGREFLRRVRELVNEVAEGDFERMDVYESKLDALEQFIAEQSAQVLRAGSDAAALVERKETDLRLQQRYMQQLQASLAPVAMPDFLREFLAQVWSQAIVMAGRDGGAEREQRLRQSGRDLVMSVQPKGGTAQRQAFLAMLPGLMRSLNEGLDLIAWPEAARKSFFAALLPAHAESLKGQGLSPLDHNLLVKQLDGVFGVAAPTEQDLPANAPLEVPEDLDLAQRLSADEAKRLGLVQDTKVDWEGHLDIDLSAGEAPLSSVDISIDGLPAAEAPEPSQGALLLEHLQLGFAYQMNTGDQWRKVRLAHISAGRSFFIFTYGQKHQETVTMTARMLKRLCEAGRLKAFESAYLLERATARARKQLAELSKTA
ncbi:MAG: DUF1631 family protein [Roseateles sp.]